MSASTTRSAGQGPRVNEARAATRGGPVSSEPPPLGPGVERGKVEQRDLPIEHAQHPPQPGGDPASDVVVGDHGRSVADAEPRHRRREASDVGSGCRPARRTAAPPGRRRRRHRSLRAGVRGRTRRARCLGHPANVGEHEVLGHAVRQRARSHLGSTSMPGSSTGARIPGHVPERVPRASGCCPGPASVAQITITGAWSLGLPSPNVGLRSSRSTSHRDESLGDGRRPEAGRSGAPSPGGTRPCGSPRT